MFKSIHLFQCFVPFNWVPTINTSKELNSRAFIRQSILHNCVDELKNGNTNLFLKGRFTKNSFCLKHCLRLQQCSHYPLMCGSHSCKVFKKKNSSYVLTYGCNAWICTVASHANQYILLCLLFAKIAQTRPKNHPARILSNLPGFRPAFSKKKLRSFFINSMIFRYLFLFIGVKSICTMNAH